MAGAAGDDGRDGPAHTGARPPWPGCCRRAERGRSSTSTPPAGRPGCRSTLRSTPHRQFALTRLPIDDVLTVKRASETTFNDVVVAVCTGALRRWLLAHDELPTSPVVAMVPVLVAGGQWTARRLPRRRSPRRPADERRRPRRAPRPHARGPARGQGSGTPLCLRRCSRTCRCSPRRPSRRWPAG